MKARNLFWFLPIILLMGLYSGCGPKGDSIDSEFQAAPSSPGRPGPVNKGVAVKPGVAAIGKGYSQKFTASGGSGTILWALTGAESKVTNISQAGLLTAGKDETAKILVVTASQENNVDKFGTAIVSVIGNGDFPAEFGLSVSPGVITMGLRAVQPFTAVQSATGNAATSVVTWTVYSTNDGSGTGITREGVLTVGASERAAKLTVTAACADGKYGTAIVYIKENGGVPEGGGPYPSNLGLSVIPPEITLDIGGTPGDLAAYDSGGITVTDAKWSLEGAADSSVTDGRVTVGPGETAKKIRVKAVKDGLSGEAVASVRGNEEAPMAVSNGLRIEPAATSVAPGTYAEFSAYDSGNNKLNATWRVLGGGSSGTKVNSAGKLEVAEDEEAIYLTLRAESSDGKYGTAVITTFVVTVTPAVSAVKPGGEPLQFTAEVKTGNKHKAKTVKWEVAADGKSGGTSIDASGLLTVAADETAEVLTIRAIPDAKPEMYAEASAYTKGARFVAVAIGSDAAAYSFDGLTWGAATLPISTDWYNVAYGGGRFVAITYGSGGPYTMDGITWKPAETPPTRAAYSLDGITWKLAATPPANADWRGLAYGEGADGISRFVAVADDGNRTAYSTDGDNWVTTENLPNVASWWRVAYGKGADGIGKFVAIVNIGVTLTNKAAYSTDGITWAESALPGTEIWYDITYGNGRFVAVAGNNGAAYSLDGINWTVSTAPPFSAALYCVTYGGGKFVAPSSNSNLTAYSTNGDIWENGTGTPSSKKWYRAVYGQGKFVMVPGDSKNTMAAYSDDGGDSWTATLMPTSVTWFDLTARND